MERRPSAAGAILAAVVLSAGLGLLALHVYWVWIPGAPLEEPANPGNTPNPSTHPWSSNPEREEREYRRGRIEAALVMYGLPVAGLLLAGLGVFLMSGMKRGAA